MRVCVTERRDPSPGDLLPAGELAPDLALPWVAKLRYGLLAGLASLILLTHYVFGVGLPIAWLAIPLALMAASNLFARRVIDLLGTRPALGTLLALDILCLTALLALTGGPANPFTVLYLVQIALSAVILSKAWTWALGLASAAGFGLLFAVHLRLPIFEAHHAADGFSAHLTGMWLAFAAGALLITVFIGKVSEALRKREQEVLALRDRLARHERLGAIATLAAGAAHELGTPLGTIAVASRDLEYYATEISRDAGVAEDARLIRSEVERCRRILNQMSARGAEPPGEAPAIAQLEEFLESVIAGLPPVARPAIRTEVAGALREAAFPRQAARQALTALVKNALDASEAGQTVSVSAEAAGGKLRFTVRDSGHGMSPDALNRVGEPFYTTKAPGQGMGLGAFLARLLAQRLDGSLSFDSEVGAGTRAVLEFPLIEDHGARGATGAGG
ncbi:MAG: ATP-binding protein [Bryobacteraceae bacterium]|jgi:two-component system sensor histidine kinase RegB